MKQLIKIERFKREDGIMSFKVWNEKYSKEIDYELIPIQQIEKILNKKIYVYGNNYFIIKK